MLVLIPHTLLGLYSLDCFFRGKSNISGLAEDSTSNVILHGLVGVVFAGSGILYLICNSYQTYQCSHAVQAEHVTTLSGKVEAVNSFLGKRFEYEFNIDGQTLKTKLQGSECGFISPMGKFHKPRVGEQAVIKLFENKVVYASFSQ